MLTHDDMLRLQAEEHGLIAPDGPRTLEEQCLHLIHLKAYEEAAGMPGQAVLDVGCNTGYGTRLLGRHRREIVGVDVSAEAVRQARQLPGTRRVAFQVMDGKELPFADGRFDLVVSFQVIEHVVDHASYLSEIRRVLAPHGRAVFTTPNAVLRLLPGMKPWNPFHVREFGALQLEQLLDPHFAGIEIRGLFGAEGIRSVEMKRLERLRTKALRKENRARQGVRWLRERARKGLPRGWVLAASGTFRWLKGRPLPAAPQGGRSACPFSTRDLFYATRNLDQALDLMAVCDRGQVDDAEADRSSGG
ncbi:MAG: class I SAM-dependent methyltransferase [Acidobacteriota bacterium]